MAYCELLLQNSLSLLVLLEWLIDMNLAIVYLLANFFLLIRIVKIIAIFTFDNYTFKYFRQFLNIDFCETCIS